MRTIEGRAVRAARSTAASSSSEEPCPLAPKASGTGRLRSNTGHGGGQDDQGEGDGEEVEGHEGKDREGDEDGVVEGALADPNTASTTIAITTGCTP